MGFCTVWASATSTTSRGVLVRSAAQSRKLDRIPCGMAGTPSSFMRAAGMVQTPASKSISSHVAKRTSPDRAAGRVVECHHRRPVRRHRALCAGVPGSEKDRRQDGEKDKEGPNAP